MTDPQPIRADRDPHDAGRAFTPPTPATLADCDDEPIHIPGAVQPHGCLFEVVGDTLRVRSVSSNVRRLLGVAAGEVLGQPLAKTLGDEIAGWIRQRLPVLPPAALLAQHNSGAGDRFGTVIFHHYVDRNIVEWIADAEHSFPTPARMDEQIAAMLAAAGAASGVQEAMDHIAEGVKAVTGYDGVMVYRFHADWHGEVVAEQHRTGLASYRGLHYPASDIPAQARRLYVETRARVIADVYANDAVLMEQPGTRAAAPLDLSHAFTRSVSPVHIQYLRNMGSGATLVTSLVIGGKLWGLIACHHRSAYAVPWYAFDRMRRFTDDASAVIAQHLARQKKLGAQARDQALAAIQANIEAPIGDTLESLGHLLGADGVIAYLGGHVLCKGAGATSERGLEMAAAVLGQPDDSGSTDTLGQRFPALAASTDCAGLAWVVLSRPYQAVLLLVRSEFRTTVHWSGNPDKAIVRDPVTQRLSPRGSFDLWKQTIGGHSRPWDVGTLDVLEFLRDRVDIAQWSQHLRASGAPTDPGENPA